MINKVRIEFLIAIAIFAVAFSSCIPMSVLTLEFPKPAPSPIPNEIQSLTLINQIPVNLYNNYEEDTLQYEFYRKNFVADTFIYDLKSADTILPVLGELLYDSRRFDYVIPREKNYNPDSNIYKINTLPWDVVESICREFKTDAVLSLEFFTTEVITMLEKVRNYDFNLEGNTFYYRALIKIRYTALFKIYDPKERSVVTSHLLKDTLTWDAEGVTVNSIFDVLTPVKKALIETGIAVAINFSDKIAPTWYPEKRKYFATGDQAFSAAREYVKNNDWFMAIQEWEKTAVPSKPKSIRSKAEFNLALGYEMLGDLNQAIRWGVRSYETMYRQSTYNYLLKLKNKKELEKAKEDSK